MRSPKKLLCTDASTARLRRTSIILVLTTKTGNWFGQKIDGLYLIRFHRETQVSNGHPISDVGHIEFVPMRVVSGSETETEEAESTGGGQTLESQLSIEGSVGTLG
jgi:hypothetical protein